MNCVREKLQPLELLLEYQLLLEVRLEEVYLHMKFQGQVRTGHLN